MESEIDFSMIAMPIVQNQALLRTILRTQARILAKLEERDANEVHKELLDQTTHSVRLVAKALSDHFPKFVYIDSNQ